MSSSNMWSALPRRRLEPLDVPKPPRAPAGSFALKPTQSSKSEADKMLPLVFQRPQELEAKFGQGKSNKEDVVFTAMDTGSGDSSDSIDAMRSAAELDSDDVETAEMNDFVAKLEKLSRDAHGVKDSFESMRPRNKKKLNSSTTWGWNDQKDDLFHRLDLFASQIQHESSTCAHAAKTTRIQELKELLDVDRIEPIIEKIEKGASFSDLARKLRAHQAANISKMLKKVYAHVGKPVIEERSTFMDILDDFRATQRRERVRPKFQNASDLGKPVAGKCTNAKSGHGNPARCVNPPTALIQEAMERHAARGGLTYGDNNEPWSDSYHNFVRQPDDHETKDQPDKAKVPTPQTPDTSCSGEVPEHWEDESASGTRCSKCHWGVCGHLEGRACNCECHSPPKACNW